ncbi:MAG: S41 family peptidase [Patescibacteria group bacterium]|nr:S41 family peptidase [Patescibacteria group bacterium]
MLNRQNPRFRTLQLISAILAVAIGSFLLGGYFARAGATGALTGTEVQKSLAGVGSKPLGGTLSDTSLQFSQFWELWKLLKLKYYQDASEEKMFYGAMQGMADSLGDPYTTFFEPVIAKEFSDSLKGEFEGIGAEIGVHNSQLQIIAPLPDTPAEKAGLMAGDYILDINGTSTEGMSTDEAVSLIRGPKGTDVTLKIGRLPVAVKSSTTKKSTTTAAAAEPNVKDYKITRDTIIVKSVNLTWPKDNIAMIEVTNFNEDTDTTFKSVVAEALAKNPKGIILDLRNDPGGYLDRSTVVAGAWVGDQTVVSERRKGKIVDAYQGSGDPVFKDIPTVVLVNQGTASAAEIVAGALQDYGLGELIGMKTFGKGSVQDYSDFSDGSAIKITIAEWLTPKGRSINKIGIQPDIEVDRTADDYDQNRDPQLDKALEWFDKSTTK